MKKSALYFGAIVTMFCAISCSSDSPNSKPIVDNQSTVQAGDNGNTGDRAPSPEDVVTQTGDKPLTPDQVKDVVKERLEADPKTRSEKNTASVYRYLTSSPEHSFFGLLISKSSLTKSLHHDPHTIFAPLDNYWNEEDKKTLSGWMKNSETAKIDAYVKNHLISMIVSAQKIMQRESVDSEGKKPFVLDIEKTTVHGIEYVTTDYSVTNGNIIALKGNFPV
jgi:hypothetical protein